MVRKSSSSKNELQEKHEVSALTKSTRTLGEEDAHESEFLDERNHNQESGDSDKTPPWGTRIVLPTLEFLQLEKVKAQLPIKEKDPLREQIVKDNELLSGVAFKKEEKTPHKVELAFKIPTLPKTPDTKQQNKPVQKSTSHSSSSDKNKGILFFFLYFTFFI